MKNFRTLNEFAELYDALNDYMEMDMQTKLRDAIVESYNETINSLDTIDKSIIKKDTSLIPVFKINEGYGVDLESLYNLVYDKNITLTEALDEIMDANNIMECETMYCILPENIDESTTIRGFGTICRTLRESSIIPVSTREYNYDEFVNEKGLGRETYEAMGKQYKYSDRYTGQLLTLRNFITLTKNVMDNPTKTGKFENIHPRLLKVVASCKTLEEVNYLKRDARAADIQLAKLKQNRPEIAKEIDAHNKWCKTVYMKALNDKAKELKEKEKAKK